jgi:F0F1-type ATP synthase assembly protein I
VEKPTRKVGLFLGVFLGYLLDRAARNAVSGR